MMDGRALYILLISLVFANADSNITMIANDFVFTFINLYTEGKSGFILLVLVSNNNNRTANVTVDSPYPSFNNITVSVAPYSILKIPITPESIQAQYLGNMTTARGQVTVEDKGVRLQSDLPVSVYAHAEVSDGQNADSFLVLPAVHLGTEYVAVTSTDPNAPNMIAVVAYQDNTQISLPTQGVTLNALQVASVTVKTAVSCSIISGNKPFGVISGCTCGTVDGICGYEAVMSFPVDDWGTQFAAIPLMFLTMNYYQVIANTDNTVVSVGEGTTIVTLNAGEYQRFQIGAALVTSNYPIQLIQIGQNTGEKGNNTGGPFFLQLPSTDKMSNTNVLFQPTGFFEYKGVHLVFFLRIVTNLAGTGTIQLDGTTISTLQFKRVPDSNVYYYESTVLNTTHSVTTNNPGTQFSVISYTYGDEKGCGFVGAFDLTKDGSTATESARTTTPETTTSSKKASLITRPLLGVILFELSVSFLFQKLYDNFALSM